MSKSNNVKYKVCQKLLDSASNQLNELIKNNENHKLNTSQIQQLDRYQIPREYYAEYRGKREQYQILITYYYYINKVRPNKFHLSTPDFVNKKLLEAFRQADQVKSKENKGETLLDTIAKDYGLNEYDAQTLIDKNRLPTKARLLQDIDQQTTQSLLNSKAPFYFAAKHPGYLRKLFTKKGRFLAKWDTLSTKFEEVPKDSDFNLNGPMTRKKAISACEQEVFRIQVKNAYEKFAKKANETQPPNYDEDTYKTLEQIKQANAKLENLQNQSKILIPNPAPIPEYTANQSVEDNLKSLDKTLNKARTRYTIQKYNSRQHHWTHRLSQKYNQLAHKPAEILRSFDLAVNAVFPQTIARLIVFFPKALLGAARLVRDILSVIMNVAWFFASKLFRPNRDSVNDKAIETRLKEIDYLIHALDKLNKLNKFDEKSEIPQKIRSFKSQLESLKEGKIPDSKTNIKSQAEFIHYYLELDQNIRQYFTFRYVEKREKIPAALVDAKLAHRIQQHLDYTKKQLIVDHEHNAEGALQALARWETNRTFNHLLQHPTLCAYQHRIGRCVTPKGFDTNLLSIVKEFENIAKHIPDDNPLLQEIERELESTDQLLTQTDKELNQADEDPQREQDALNYKNNLEQYKTKLEALQKEQPRENPIKTKFEKQLFQLYHIGCKETAAETLRQIYNIYNDIISYYGGYNDDHEQAGAAEQRKLMKALKQKIHTYAKTNGLPRRIVTIEHKYKNTLPEKDRKLILDLKRIFGHNTSFYLQPEGKGQIDKAEDEIKTLRQRLKEAKTSDEKILSHLNHWHSNHESDLNDKKKAQVQQAINALQEKNTNYDKLINYLNEIREDETKSYEVEARRHLRREIKKILKRFKGGSAWTVGTGEGLVTGVSAYQAFAPSIQFLSYLIGGGGLLTNFYLMAMTGEKTQRNLYLDKTYKYDPQTGEKRPLSKQIMAWTGIFSSVAGGITLGSVSFLSGINVWQALFGIGVLSTGIAGFIAAWTGFAIQQLLFSGFADFVNNDRWGQFKAFLRRMSFKSIVGHSLKESTLGEKIKYGAFMIIYAPFQILSASFGLIPLTVAFLAGVAMSAALGKASFALFYQYLGFTSKMGSFIAAHIVSKLSIWGAFFLFNLQAVGNAIKAVVTSIRRAIKKVFTKPKEAAQDIGRGLLLIAGTLSIVGIVGYFIKEHRDRSAKLEKANKNNEKQEIQESRKEEEQPLINEGTQRTTAKSKEAQLVYKLGINSDDEEKLISGARKHFTKINRFLVSIKQKFLYLCALLNGAGQGFLGLGGVNDPTFGREAQAVLFFINPVYRNIPYFLGQFGSSFSGNLLGCRSQGEPPAHEGCTRKKYEMGEQSKEEQSKNDYNDYFKHMFFSKKPCTTDYAAHQINDIAVPAG